MLRYNGNKCAKEYIGNNNIVNITIDPDPPQFKVTNNTLYSENNESVEGNTNDTCLTKYYTLLPENKIHEESFKKLKKILNNKFPKLYYEFFLMNLKSSMKRFNV